MRALPDSIDRILIDEETIGAKVAELAQQVSSDYHDEDDLILIGVLKGAFIFMADLSRRLTIRHSIDFVALSSYADGEARSGAVRLIMDTRNSLNKSNILIVEDIVDTGHTLNYLHRLLELREPKSMRTCVLLKKPEREEVAVHIDYLGFEIPNEWVVGYGLDYADRFRTLPYIGALKPSAYKK
jgi:hypoxanthine phosphoribosyltransferase